LAFQDESSGSDADMREDFSMWAGLTVIGVLVALIGVMYIAGQII
jgi:hypothetical protein